MKFNYLEDVGITEVITETDDICVMCNLFEECPFISAVEANLVYPSASKITVDECALYLPDYDEKVEN